MLIDIRHVTTYRYDASARYAIQSLRLTPPTFPGQRVLDWSISVPGSSPCASYRDAYNNLVHVVALYGAHDTMSIEAAGTVDTANTDGIVRGTLESAPLRVFLRETARTKVAEPLRALAKSVTGSGPLERMHDLMRRAREALTYEISATSATTTAAEALALGKGVCQDYAHIFIACAREIGIPARYVNGYYLAGSDGPSEAHHAWAEAWIDNLGWVGFDPANNLCPNDHYVRLACGLDAASAAPIRGTRRGGTNETLDVIVEVQQQVAQQ